MELVTLGVDVSCFAMLYFSTKTGFLFDTPVFFVGFFFLMRKTYYKTSVKYDARTML